MCRPTHLELRLLCALSCRRPTVLIAPTSTGFNRVAWIMPYLALTLGIATVVLIVRAWKHRPLPVSPSKVAPVTGVELERFREQARRDTAI